MAYMNSLIIKRNAWHLMHLEKKLSAYILPLYFS